ncbi:MAG: family 1 glycosylhydrolase, partial [Oscillospiraceae bacterium]|nr:family 1 glycosylhydrolase [Oscillospiraceae bacterium]
MGFSDNFVWGAATASYQIEGAAAEDGKGKNIWDVFSHTDGKISDNSSGDIACDHYHKFKEDVKLMSELGLKAYRFSVSWSRIIPDGTGKINQAGINFYSELIDELLKYGIEPYVTLYHWDLPYALHLQGGWLNDKISDWFAEYTAVCAELFGGRVKNVITFNEPEVFVGCGYFEGVHAPGLALGKEELLHIGHNVLKSHGKAVRVLREKIPDVKIGFVTATMPPCPVSEKDAAAAAKSYFSCGRGHFLFADAYWIDPVVFGKYPDSILNECADILPEITEEDMALISSSIDFLGLNIYQGRYVREGENGY